jgi:hypothetical protein
MNSQNLVAPGSNGAHDEKIPEIALTGHFDPGSEIGVRQIQTNNKVDKPEVIVYGLIIILRMASHTVAGLLPAICP